MRVVIFALALLGVAFGQDDAVKVTVQPSGGLPSFGGPGFGPGPCAAGQEIACTNSIPPSCTCGPQPVPLPRPIPFPLPPRDCACFALFDPVCGVDKRTYGNSCEAGCKRVKVACKGRCPCKRPPPPDRCPDGSPRRVCIRAPCPPCPPPPPPPGCICPAIFKPVCGKDGTTYSNSCEAQCASQPVACEGTCPCKKPSPPTDCFFKNGRFQGRCRPSPSPPSTPSEINKFLDECVKKGNAASVAAARAACSTLKNKCPSVKPRVAFASSAAAGFAQKADFNPADALLEAVLEGACLSEAENACKSKASDNLRDSACKRILSNGPASPVPGCETLKKAVDIFDGEVTRLCRKK